VVLVSVLTGCAVARTGTAPVAGGALPSPAAPGRDSLHITVVYPAVTDIIQAYDSAFLFGSVRGGSGGPVHLGSTAVGARAPERRLDRLAAAA